MVSETFLKFGVQFPLHPYFRSILNYYNLTVFQVTPNGWAHMIRLFALFVEWKMEPPTLEEFTWFYTLKPFQSNLGFYYFSKRASKDIWVIIKIREILVLGRMPTSTHPRLVLEVVSLSQVSFP